MVNQVALDPAQQTGPDFDRLYTCPGVSLLFCSFAALGWRPGWRVKFL